MFFLDRVTAETRNFPIAVWRRWNFRWLWRHLGVELGDRMQLRITHPPRASAAGRPHEASVFSMHNHEAKECFLLSWTLVLTHTLEILRDVCSLGSLICAQVLECLRYQQ